MYVGHCECPNLGGGTLQVSRLEQWNSVSECPDSGGDEKKQTINTKVE